MDLNESEEKLPAASFQWLTEVFEAVINGFGDVKGNNSGEKDLTRGGIFSE